MKIVVTGTSRGIGLEFCRQFLERGDSVAAAARDPAASPELKALAQKYPQKCELIPCDVSVEESVRAFVATLEAGPVDVLVNNAGVLNSPKALTELDFQQMLLAYQVNALGPLRVTCALLPRLRQSKIRKVAHISSRMGSISDNTSGGAYGYRMAKAALNMASKSLAVDLYKEGIASVVLNPGWVKTDMGGSGAPTPTDEAVRGLIKVIDNLTLEQSGSFLDYRGPTVPW